MNFSLARSRLERVALALVIFGLVISSILYSRYSLDLSLFDTRVPVVPEDPPGTWAQHPIVLLHERAQRQFDALVQRQSKTPDEAEAEYTRRYERQPPPGFRQWVEYALAHESPIIDDFDAISDGVHRFLNFNAGDVAHRMRQAKEDSIGRGLNDGIERCRFTEGRFSAGCRNFAAPLTALLGDAGKIAPDVEFLINFLDEPSVLLGQQGPKGSLASSWKDLSHQPIAPAVVEACRFRGQSISGRSENKSIPTYGLPFVQDVGATKDLCQHPEYALAHGFVMCPPTLRQMPTETPILSQAAPFPFSDILYPSTHYGLESSLYKQSQDRGWERKQNAVYWAGTSTGGQWSQDTWRHGHRQRLATLGMPKEERDFVYLRSLDAGGAVEAYTTAAFDTSRYNIALNKIVGCDNEAVCDEQKRFFGVPRPFDPESRPFRYRYVVDIDGNSYSGRFYRFLASRSVPLKLSIFREWHDDRLVPWLHYIPVSQSMDELPELMRFLATTGEGQKISRRIAEAGREWYFKAIAPVHQGIYLHRLMLELAWMLDETRPPG